MLNARLNLRRQAGLSIVELLVGVAIGLFVVAAAAMLTSTQLVENRRLLLETQVQQDLRATADIVARDMRRAGSWWNAYQGVWYPGSTGVVVSPMLGMTPSAIGSQTDYKYIRSGGNQGPYGFKLQSGRIKSYFASTAGTASGGWQDLTDASTMLVTSFSITPRLINEPTPAGLLPQKMPCPKLCPGGTTACWPTVLVREYQVDITATAVSDPSVRRSVRSMVSVRNDELQSNVPGGDACPG